MFLDDVILEEYKPLAPLKRLLSNWVKVADHIYEEECITEGTLLVLLKLEMSSKNRPYMVTRLYSRYSKLRSRRERKEIAQWNLKKSQKSTSSEESKREEVLHTSGLAQTSEESQTKSVSSDKV